MNLCCYGSVPDPFTTSATLAAMSGGYDVSRPQCTALRETPLHLAIGNRHLDCATWKAQTFSKEFEPGLNSYFKSGIPRPSACWRMEPIRICRTAMATHRCMWPAAWATQQHFRSFSCFAWQGAKSQVTEVEVAASHFCKGEASFIQQLLVPLPEAT